ncbi:MAG TPA: hypothetical protein VNG33_09630, partial [Polyangiaceae bacterium]|nr:hypothetical protein [Polyangiaceae bacterium]
TPELGRALAAPDRLFETHDGGASFSERSPRPPAALDEPLAWLGADPQLPRLPEIDDETARPVFLAWLRRALESEAGRLTSGIRLTDGTWVRLATRPMQFYLGFRRPNGRITTFEVKGGLCDVLPWGAKVVIPCSEGADSIVVFGPDGREPIVQPQHRPRRVVAGPAGRYIAFSAWPDEPGSRKPGARALFDGTTWQDLPELEDEPIAIRQGQLLFTQEELDAGATPRAYVLPSNTGVAGLADRLHGVRLYNHREPGLTNDGGKHFAALIADGALFDWGADVRCWEHGCALGDQVAYTDEPFTDEQLLSAGPTPAEADEDLPLASRPAQADEQPAQDAEPYRNPMQAPPTNAPTFHCKASPALPKESAFVERLFKLQKAPNGKPRFERATALGGLFERQGGGLSWHGRDAAGDFRVETPPLSGAGQALVNPELQLVPTEFAVEDGAVAPLFVARGFALVLQLTGDAALLFVVRADGKTELLRSGSLGGYQLIPAAGGGVALLASQQSHDSLFALDPSGSVWAKRWLATPHGQLALSPAGPLEVVAKPGGRADVYWATPGSPPQDMAFDAKSTFPPCTRPAASDAWLMLAGGFDGPRVVLEELSSSPFVYPTHWAAPSTALGILERTARGSCLRGVIMSQPFVAQLAQAPGGGMTGTLFGPDVNHALSCTRERAAKAAQP